MGQTVCVIISASERRHLEAVVADRSGLHKHVQRTRIILTSGSWLNAVENLFSRLTRQRIRRGVFRSIVDLQAAIKRYLDEHNADPKTFVWTKPATVILNKLAVGF